MSDARNAAAGRTVVSVIEEQGRKRGDALAYRFLIEGEVHGEQATRSYSEVAARARAIGAWLQREGRRGDRAVLLYPPGLDFLEGFYGAQFGGLIAVPAYPPDPSRLQRSLPRRRAILGDCQARFVLTTRMVLDFAAGLFALSPELAQLQWVATDEIPTELESDWQDPDVQNGDISFLQYTSGSTGAPKGGDDHPRECRR